MARVARGSGCEEMALMHVYLPHQEACVSLDEGVPIIIQPWTFLTTRTSFGAKVQEIAPESARRPAGWSLVCLAGRLEEQEEQEG